MPWCKNDIMISWYHISLLRHVSQNQSSNFVLVSFETKCGYSQKHCLYIMIYMSLSYMLLLPDIDETYVNKHVQTCTGFSNRICTYLYHRIQLGMSLRISLSVLRQENSGLVFNSFNVQSISCKYILTGFIMFSHDCDTPWLRAFPNFPR